MTFPCPQASKRLRYILIYHVRSAQNYCFSRLSFPPSIRAYVSRRRGHVCELIKILRTTLRVPYRKATKKPSSERAGRVRLMVSYCVREIAYACIAPEGGRTSLSPPLSAWRPREDRGRRTQPPQRTGRGCPRRSRASSSTGCAAAAPRTSYHAIQPLELAPTRGRRDAVDDTGGGCARASLVPHKVGRLPSARERRKVSGRVPDRREAVCVCVRCGVMKVSSARAQARGGRISHMPHWRDGLVITNEEDVKKADDEHRAYPRNQSLCRTAHIPHGEYGGQESGAPWVRSLCLWTFAKSIGDLSTPPEL